MFVEQVLRPWACGRPEAESGHSEEPVFSGDLRRELPFRVEQRRGVLDWDCNRVSELTVG